MAKKMGIRTMGAPPKPIAKRTPARRVTARPLTPRQAAFLERYLLTLNASAAYAQSHPGCLASTAATEGSLLLKDPRIAKEVKARVAEVTKRFAPTGKKALGELAAIAFSNVQDLYDSQWKLKPIDQLPTHAAAAIKKVKRKAIEAIDVASGETKVVRYADELELHDKIAALRMIGQHEGMFAEKLGPAVGTEFAAALREARARAIAMRGELPPIEGEKVTP